LIFDIPTVPPIQISTEKGPWVFLSKFRCRTILMHFSLPICGKFTHAQLSHQIFCFRTSFYKSGKFSYLNYINMNNFAKFHQNRLTGSMSQRIWINRARELKFDSSGLGGSSILRVLKLEVLGQVPPKQSLTKNGKWKYCRQFGV
jgi:hypothetical protein